MRIVGYNILRSGHGREQLIADVLRAADADLAILTEAGDPQAVKTIACLADFPFHASRQGDSVAFLSRVPVAHHWHKRPLCRSPFVEVVPEAGNLHIYGVHLWPMLYRLAERLRVREVRMLLQVTAQRRDAPHVIIGDFNAIAPDDTIDIAAMPFWLRATIWLHGGNVRRDALATLQDAGYVDAFRQLHPGENGYSLPTPEPNSRLDYAFVPAHAIDSVRDCRVLREPEAVDHASDHFPVLIELDPTS